MKDSRWVYRVILGIGALMSAAGAATVMGYLWWAVFIPWGEPDQSLLYWYSPFLLFGLILGGVGAPVGAYALRRLRAQRR